MGKLIDRQSHLSIEDMPLGRQYTRKEAQQVEEKFYRSAVETRHWLLDLFTHSAHKSFGFTSFEEYASERLHLDMTKQHAYQLRQWAKVEVDALIPVDGLVDASNTTVLLETVAKRPLTRDVALELAKLPSDVRRPAYEEAVALGATGKGELSCIKHIVTRRLNELNGKPPAIKEPPSPKADPAPAATPARPLGVTPD